MLRRNFLAGLAILAAPAIVRTPGLLMPVRVVPRNVALQLAPDGAWEAFGLPSAFALDATTGEVTYFGYSAEMEDTTFILRDAAGVTLSTVKFGHIAFRT